MQGNRSVFCRGREWQIFSLYSGKLWVSLLVLQILLFAPFEQARAQGEPAKGTETIQQETMSMSDNPNSITRVNPAGIFDSTATGYSQISVVEPGRMAFVSGQVAWSENGESAPSDLAEQTKLVIKSLAHALDALGATTHDIVKLTIFAIDLSSEAQGKSMPLLMEFLDGAQPSLTGIGVQALAGPELQLEIEMIVRVPD